MKKLLMNALLIFSVSINASAQYKSGGENGGDKLDVQFNNYEGSLSSSTLVQADFVELIAETRSAWVSYNPEVKKFQSEHIQYELSNHILVDPESGERTISNIKRRNRFVTMKWNLKHDGSNLYEYNSKFNSYNQIGNNLGWEDAVKVGDKHYGVRRQGLEEYDLATQTHTPLQTINAFFSSKLQKIEADSDGNLYIASLTSLSTSDRNHEVWKYNTKTKTLEKVFENNTDELDYTSINGMAIVDGKIYLMFSSSHANFAKTSIRQIMNDNTLHTTWERAISETGAAAADDFVGFLNDNGKVRFALQFKNWQKTLVLKETLPPKISTPISPQTLTENFGSVEIDLSTLTSNASDTKTVASISSDIITATVSGNTLTLTSTVDANGIATITLDVTNVVGTTQTTLEISVGSAPGSPMITSPLTDTATEGVAYTYTAVGTDADGNDLTFTAADLPDWLTDNGDGTFTGTPDNDQVGDHTFTLVAADGNEGADAQTVTITVEGVDDAPGGVTGIDDLTKERAITHYPNSVHAGQAIYTTVNRMKTANVRIELINMSGQVIANTIEKMKPGANTISTDTQNLESGVYIMRVVIEGESRISAERIVIQ